jgi:hypothetical protein
MGPKSAIWLGPELFLDNLIKYVEVFNKIAYFSDNGLVCCHGEIIVKLALK